MVVSAVPDQAPEIVATGVVGRRRAWKIQIPVIVRYTNGTATTPKHYLVRMPVTVNPEGVSVTQLVMGEG